MEPAHLIDHLRRRLQQPLPGQEAQFRMAHLGRELLVPPPPDARLAGVMALFYPGNHPVDWHVVLIERVRKQGDRHSGQIGFPGGKYEPDDTDLWSTALRETEEEVGVKQSAIEWLGALTPLYIPVSRFLVHPFVGVIDNRPLFRPQVSEVSSILEIPLTRLKDPAARKTTDLSIVSGPLLRNVPYYDLHGHIVWGATAMMLSELLEVTI